LIARVGFSWVSMMEFTRRIRWLDPFSFKQSQGLSFGVLTGRLG
jgi:hypothetical protein